MLRELQTVLNKNTDSMCKAEVAMTVGMGVVKDYANKTVEFPTAATDRGVYFVTKERIPTGEDCGKGELSDYYEKFNSISVNELVKLVEPLNGERYAVDTVDTAGLAIGDSLAVGTNGKFAKSTPVTKFVYAGTYNDAGYALHVIQVVA